MWGKQRGPLMHALKNTGNHPRISDNICRNSDISSRTRTWPYYTRRPTGSKEVLPRLSTSASTSPPSTMIEGDTLSRRFTGRYCKTVTNDLESGQHPGHGETLPWQLSKPVTSTDEALGGGRNVCKYVYVLKSMLKSIFNYESDVM